jgi:hypothetical protein
MTASILEDVEQILRQDGPFARRFPAYEYRPQQLAMAEAVTT